MKQIGLAVASYYATYKRSAAARVGQPTLEWLVGVWISDVHQTKLGLLQFTFEFGHDRRFKVTGLAATSPSETLYYRAGKYEVREGRFISTAINDGQPVQLQPQEGNDLLFVIDDTLSLRLRKTLTL